MGKKKNNLSQFNFFFCLLIEMTMCNMYMKPAGSQAARICYIYGARHMLKSK